MQYDLSKIFENVRFDTPRDDDWVVAVNGKLWLGDGASRWLFPDKAHAQNTFRNSYRWRQAKQYGEMTNTLPNNWGYRTNYDREGWRLFLHQANVEFLTYKVFKTNYGEQN